MEEANTAVDKREKSRRRMQGLASARQAIETARNSQVGAAYRVMRLDGLVMASDCFSISNSIRNG